MTTLTPNLAHIDCRQPQNFDIKLTPTWTRIIYNFLTADKQELWTARVHSKSVEFFTTDGLLLGTCTYHTWKSDVEIHLEQTRTDFTMTRNKGMFNEAKSFELSGGKFTWKRVGMWKKSGLWKLIDQDERELAIIGHDDWKVNSRFEIVMPGMDSTLVLAILISGLSELESQRRLSGAAAASSANAAAAAAASAAAAV
jgi:hypothetical protein